MKILTTRIVYGPGRFVPGGTTLDVPDREGHELVGKGWAEYVDGPYGRVEEPRQPMIETAMKSTGPENAMKPNSPRVRPQEKR